MKNCPYITINLRFDILIVWNSLGKGITTYDFNDGLKKEPWIIKLFTEVRGNENKNIISKGFTPNNLY